MKNIFFALCLLGLWACASHPDRLETATADLKAPDARSFWEKVENLTLLPLQGPDSLIIGPGSELLIADDEYYLVDILSNHKIYRFSSDGTFLNEIGRTGKGPGEYLGIRNAAILGDTVVICASPRLKFLYYAKDGVLLREEVYEQPVEQAIPAGSNYLVYAGYGQGIPERLFRYAPALDSRHFLLDGSARILSMGETSPVFYPDKDRIYFRETFGDTIFRYDLSRAELIPHLRFDFGSFAIPRDYFTFSDPMAAAEYFFAQPRALIRRYLDDGAMRLAEVLLNKPGDTGAITYGFQPDAGTSWIWFGLGDMETGAFPLSLRVFRNGCLYALLDPDRLSLLTETERSKIANPQVLGTVSEEDGCPVIAVFRFK